MTFKHGKFEDSATMRSLIKVAQQKGWVQTEPLKKQASTTINLSPTNSLTENILKLSAGLRQLGMTSYANELESKFINYKKANDLYDVSKEKGEDLVDAAHPDGSHQLEGVEGDSVIETIVDQHMKNMQIVEKKPNGKLSNSSAILQAVKVVLAQDAETLNNKLQGLLEQVRRRANTITILTEPELTVSWSRISDTITRLTSNPTVDSLKKIQDIMSIQAFRLKPGVLGGISEDVWSRVVPQINSLNNLTAQALSVRNQINELSGKKLLHDEEATEISSNKPTTLAPVELSSGPLDKLFRQIRGLQNKLRSWNAIKTIAQNPQASKWINDEVKSLEDIYTRYSAVPDDQQASMARNMQKEISEEIANITQFQTDWINA